MDENRAVQRELSPTELKTLQAWRDVKSRPILLPTSWFDEVDQQVSMVFGGDRTNPLIWPRRQYQILGRVLGMLVSEDVSHEAVLTALGEGPSGAEVVSRALCLEPRRTGGMAEIKHALVGGDRSRNAQVSGLLTGAGTKPRRSRCCGGGSSKRQSNSNPLRRRSCPNSARTR